jgi:NADPH:quinone reductase-like Zn-dependent oxidoreductase
MRAFVVEHLHDRGTLRDVPVPEPGDRDVVVRITVAGINPVDWKTRDVYGHALPFVLGQDFAGLVVAAGSGVREYAIDDRVFGIAREHGAYAEYTMLPHDDAAQPLAHIPDAVGDADAAGLPTAGLTALACVERCGISRGNTVAIVGVTGAVGQFAAQMARNLGARVVGTGSAAHVAVAETLGLDRFVPYEIEDFVKILREEYDGNVDVVIDLADDGEQIGAYADVVREGGTIASTIHAVDEAFFTERGRRGLNVNLDDSPQSSHDGLRRIAAMVERGELRVPIAAEHDLNSALEALDDVKGGKVAGKVLLTVEPASV